VVDQKISRSQLQRRKRSKWLWVSAASGALMLMTSPWTIGGLEQLQRESRRPLPAMPPNPSTVNHPQTSELTDYQNSVSNLTLGQFHEAAKGSTTSIDLILERSVGESPNRHKIDSELVDIETTSPDSQPIDSMGSTELDMDVSGIMHPDPNQSEEESMTEDYGDSEGEDPDKQSLSNTEASQPKSPPHIAMREATQEGERVRIAVFEPDCDIYVHESEQDGIEVRLRRYLFGTCTDQVATADDAAQLQQNFPEAYKIYQANIGKADLLGGPLSIYPVEEVSWDGPVGFLTAANQTTSKEMNLSRSKSTPQKSKSNTSAGNSKATKKEDSKLSTTKKSQEPTPKAKSLKSENNKNKTSKKPASSTSQSKKSSTSTTSPAVKSEKVKGSNGEESKAKLQGKSASDGSTSKASKLKNKTVKPAKPSASPSPKALPSETGKKNSGKTQATSAMKKKSTNSTDSSESSKKNTMNRDDSRNQASKTAKANSDSRKKIANSTGKYQET
jgi:hypothetical protein